MNYARTHTANTHKHTHTHAAHLWLGSWARLAAWDQQLVALLWKKAKVCLCCFVSVFPLYFCQPPFPFCLGLSLNLWSSRTSCLWLAFVKTVCFERRGLPWLHFHSGQLHHFTFLQCRIWINSHGQENYKHAVIKSLILKTITPWWYNYDNIYFRVWSKPYLLRAIRVQSVEDIQCSPDWESDIWIWRSSICQWTKAAGSAVSTWRREGFLPVQGRSLIQITLLL